ncbi:putative PurR-regulated permease PerM [Altererythrobacter atlanticus]|uniref:Pheromone autoinducer 2 transporter n=1 Tax=Croceibacterium atlanticum TaxID=1267766 RepID=A0A0F7KP82_9SPHN|nr:AI-2E family transporter [Croceibacterium atlanticum]AKH42333.1 pheromone autoinducer 2 transporter [Croceibacterium atlanticum]MBB5731110.1 putative PurR-regulated permease PerM [Croceibacterium atlanticum]
MAASDESFADGDRDDRASPTSISSPRLRHEAKKAAIWVLVVGTAVLTVYISQSLLVIFGGLVFASMVDGGARLLGRILPLPRGVRIGIVLLLGTAFLVWLGFFAGSQISREAAQFPEIIEAQTIRVTNWLDNQGFAISPDNMQQVASQLASGVGTVTRAIGGIVGGVTTLFLIVIIGIYVALEPRLYERGLAWMMPPTRRSHFYGTVSKMAYTMRRLMAGRIVGMVFEGIFTWLMLWAYGVPMAALLGILTGLLAFIPNVGAVISGILMVLVGFSGGVDMGLYTVFVYFLVQTFDGYIVIPLIAKKTVDLAPALVLGAQLIMGILFGIIGLFLADPLMAMIKVALERRSESNDKYNHHEDAESDGA